MSVEMTLFVLSHAANLCPQLQSPRLGTEPKIKRHDDTQYIDYWMFKTDEMRGFIAALRQ